VKLEGEYKFNGPREEVWKLVRDPEVLASALPGTKSLEHVGENEYKGEMNVRIGPVSGLFSGRLVVSNEVPPESCTLTVEGKGSPGFANGTGNVILSDLGDGTTLMKYVGEMQIGGKLASVGQRLFDTASKSMIRQGLESFNSALQARMAAKSGEAAFDYKPASESKFIAAIAKDMAGEMLSSKRVIWIAIAIVVILVIIAAIWISTGAGG
jgi:carbon monoxide dehydrogenase subunit G